MEVLLKVVVCDFDDVGENTDKSGWFFLPILPFNYFVYELRKVVLILFIFYNKSMVFSVLTLKYLFPRLFRFSQG